MAPRKKGSFKEKLLAEGLLDELNSEEDALLNIGLDEDPEYEDFGSALDRTALLKKSRPKEKTADDSRKHYYETNAELSLGKRKKIALPIDDEDFMDGKYAGKKVGRTELGFTAVKNQEESLDEDNLDLVLSDAESWLSFVEDKLDETTEKTSLSVKPMEKSLEEELEASSRMQLQLISQRLHDDAHRGRLVRTQLEKFQMVLGIRVHMQPILRAIQTLPGPREVKVIISSEESKKDNPQGLLASLINRLLSLASNNMENSSSSMKDIEAALQDYDTAHAAKWKKSLDAWHEKAFFASISNELDTQDGKKRRKLPVDAKKLRVINQTPWSQVEGALRDRERLLRKHLKGDFSTGAVYFDDEGFFSSLVRDWTGLGEDSPATMDEVLKASGVVVCRVDVKQHRPGVDRRASKGRKIKYDVQDKLVNYMVPQQNATLWDDEKIDAFYETIFATNSSQIKLLDH